jgi:predicted nucleic acid-binding protein
MTLYDKNECSELTAKEKKALQEAIDAELKSRQKKRTATARRRK